MSATGGVDAGEQPVLENPEVPHRLPVQNPPLKALNPKPRIPNRNIGEVEHVWVGCQGGVICTYDTRTFELWTMLPGHTQDVLAICRVGDTMWTAAGHIVWVWINPESSDPQVVKEINCIGKDILSLLSCDNGSQVRKSLHPAPCTLHPPPATRHPAPGQTPIS